MDMLIDFENAHHVGRSEELAIFNQLIAASHAASILYVHSDKGYGKSWLLKKYIYECQNRADKALSFVDFGEEKYEDNLQGVVDVVLEMRSVLLAHCIFSTLDEVLQSYWLRIAPSASNEAITPSMLLPFIKKLDDVLGSGGPNSERLLNDLAMSIDVDLGRVVAANDIFPNKVRNFVKEAARGSRPKLPQLIEEIPKQLEDLQTNYDWWEGLESLRDGSANGGNGKEPETLETDHGEISILFREFSRTERHKAEKEITTAFLTDLRNAQDYSYVLMFDNYDNIKGDVMDWLENELCKRLDKGELPNVLVIIAGNKKLPSVSKTDFPAIHIDESITDLHFFSREEASEYLRRRGVAEERLTEERLEAHYEASLNGHPMSLALIADNLLGIQQLEVKG